VNPAGSEENLGRRAGPGKPRAPKRPPGQKATSAPLRRGPGVPRKRRYLAIFTPSHRQHHPGLSLVGHGGHRGAAWPPQIQNLRPLGPPSGSSAHTTHHTALCAISCIEALPTALSNGQTPLGMSNANAMKQLRGPKHENWPVCDPRAAPPAGAWGIWPYKW
jgi:hypothetical protein